MRQNFKKVIAIAMTAIMMLGMSTSVFAEEEEVEASTQEEYFEVATYSVQQSITVGQEELSLYPIFDDEQLALSEINKLLSQMLDKIAQEYSLGALDSTTFTEYRDGYFNYQQNHFGEITEQDASLWLKFVDIYENFEDNADIVALVETYELGTTELSSEEYKDILAIMLPYTSSLSRAFNARIAHPKAFSVTSANDYAGKYAETPIDEEYQYYYNSGDCANFASQILEAGGVTQVDYSPDKSKGWWHYVNGRDIFGRWIHESSESWRLANVFARYQGAYASTKNHYTFSSSIAAGDFIAQDHTNDGNWDHIGYVTARDSAPANYNGKTYYDYEVAQHSGNYIAWTSSDDNGWENAEDDGETYARLRRR